MAGERSHLQIGTQIETDQGRIYQIIGPPIGCGGGSIIYPAQEMVWENGILRSEALLYALKECYPISMDHAFIRDQNGEIIPKNSSGDDFRYLHLTQTFLLSEGSISRNIYRTASRMLPIRETSQSILLTIPGHKPVTVANTITVMDSLSEKGRSLTSWLDEQGRFAPLAAFRIVQQLLFSLREVHQAGYLHLDIQDGNVFLRGTLKDKSELVTLIDFGAARPIKDGKTAPIKDRVIFTTQGFTAPEILLKNDGSLQLGAEADLYSVGCLTLYLLTGQKPNSNTLIANRTGIFLQPNQLRRIKCPAHLVGKLQNILSRALAKDPENRYHTADEMLSDVTALVDALQPYRSDLSNIDYDAFICYKHGPVDSQVAKTLQKKLEDFHAPRGISSKKHPFKRVFLDEGELSSCADFGEQIRAALKSSGWLIVICSPDTPLSPWVRSEIDTFLQYHDRSRILAVLTDGEPKTAFPLQLLGNADSSGEVLAADARGKNWATIKKKLSGDALLRLAAPMLGIPFDSLKQRRKNQRMQRIAALSAVGLSAALAFSFYAVRQNQRIQAQYRNSLLSESKYLASLAEDSLENGDPAGAMEIALRALPTKDQDRPVIPGAQFVLQQALGLYAVNDRGPLYSASVTGAFKHSGASGTLYRHDDFYWDSERDTLLSCDDSYLYIFDTLSYIPRVKIPCEAYGTIFQSDLVSEEQGHLFYAGDNHIYCYDYVNLTELWCFEAPGQINGVHHLPQSERVAVVVGSQLEPSWLILVLDSKTGTVLNRIPYDPPSDFQVPIPANQMMLAASNDESLLAFSLSTERVGEDGEAEGANSITRVPQDCIVTADLGSGSIRYFFPESGAIADLAFTPQNQLLFTANDNSWFSNGAFLYGSEMAVSICLADPAKGDILWMTQDQSSSLLENFHISFDPSFQDMAIVGYGNRCVLLNTTTGEQLRVFDFTDAIIGLRPQENGIFHVHTSGGYRYQCSYDSDEYSGFPFWPKNITDIVGEGEIFFVRSDDDPGIIWKCETHPQDENWQMLIGDAQPLKSDLIYHYFEAPYLAVYGEYGKPLTLYNTDTDTHQEICLTIEGNTCDINIVNVMGICEVAGTKNLVFYCHETNCQNQTHTWCALLCVNLDTLEQTLFYIPSVYYDHVPHTVSTVFFPFTEALFDGSGCYANEWTIYSWEMGNSLPQEIVSFEAAIPHVTDEDHSLPQDEVIPNFDGSKLLILEEIEQFTLNNYISNLYCVDTASGTSHCVIEDMISEDSLRMYGTYQIVWDPSGSRFALCCADDIRLYDCSGTKLLSIPFPEAIADVRSLYFLPNTQHLLVLTRKNTLSLFDLSTGEELATSVLPLRISGPTQWQYVDETMLLLYDQFYGLVAIDPREETWGVFTKFDTGIGYNEHTDRFYTLSKDSNGKYPIGYFQRYSIEEMVEMGNHVLGRG